MQEKICPIKDWSPKYTKNSHQSTIRKQPTQFTKWAKSLNKHLTKEGERRQRRDGPRHGSSRKCSKNINGTTTHLEGRPHSRILMTPSAGEDVEWWERSRVAGGKHPLTTRSGNRAPWHLTQGGDVCTWMLTGALFVVAGSQKQSR